MHRAHPVRTGVALGEANQLAADPDASMGWVSAEHPELARALIQALHANAPDDLVGHARHGNLPGPGELDDLAGRGAGRAVRPQASLGHRVDLVGQLADPVHQGRIGARAA